MTINWYALLQVSIVSIIATVVFVTLLAVGIRFVATSQTQVKQGSSGTATLGVGWAAIVLAGALVLFGIYLIVPQFH